MVKSKNKEVGEGSSHLLSIENLKEQQKQIEQELNSKLNWGDNEKFELKLLPFGIPTLDNLLDGGLAFDRVNMIFGDASAGKTVVALLAMKAAQDQNLSIIYIDVEHSWVPEWSAKVGVNSNDVLVVRPKTGEEVWEAVIFWIRKRVGVIVIDSLASIASSKSLNKDLNEMFEKPQPMANASLNQMGLNNAMAENEGTMLLIINQTRVSPTMYGNPETQPGGRSSAYWAWQKIRVKRGEWIEEGVGASKAKVGYMLELIVEKNKQGVPFQKTEIPFMFATGKIDYIWSMVTEAVERGIIIKRGAYYDYKENKIMGKAGFIDLIKSTPELEQYLKDDLSLPIEESSF